MQIKGLYFIWDLSPETPSLEAISYDEEILKKIRDDVKDRECYELGDLVIKDVPVYIVSRSKNNEIIFAKELVSSLDNDKLYCMNKCNEDYSVDNVLLRVFTDHPFGSDEYNEFIDKLNKMMESKNE